MTKKLQVKKHYIQWLYKRKAYADKNLYHIHRAIRFYTKQRDEISTSSQLFNSLLKNKLGRRLSDFRDRLQRFEAYHEQLEKRIIEAFQDEEKDDAIITSFSTIVAGCIDQADRIIDKQRARNEQSKNSN